MNDFRDPLTPVEWQEAVDAAEAYLALESAKAYGLVRGGPVVNVQRCEQLLRDGKQRGYSPLKENVERVIKSLAIPDGREI